MTNTEGNLFFAKVAKGYIPKTTFDVLATSMSRITLRLTKEGIFIREFDTDDIRFSHILWDVSWPRERFEVYRCVKDYVVTLNAKHLQRMLRNVKKKDSLSFFISNNDETQLGITIQPIGTQSGGPAARSETVYLNIHALRDAPIPDLPEIYIDEKGSECQAYGFPMVIGTTDFQKIKKMTGAVKTLNVKIQRSNYISFFTGDVAVMSSILAFGELSMHPDDNADLLDFWTDEECSDKDDSSDEKLKTDGERNAHPGLYEKSFAMSLFAPLVKLPGLAAQMAFYAPKLEQFPLKINIHASSGLGEITVFVKDQKQIALDDQKKAHETSTGGVANGKGKHTKK